MPLIAKEQSIERPDPVPQGTYTARCYAIYDLGTQKVEWKGQVKHKRKVVLVFEIYEERIQIEKDGETLNLPRAISLMETNSLSNNGNLRPYLKSWRGRDFTQEELASFDLFNVLGAPCLLSVVHNSGKDGRIYANIGSITKVMKGQQVPEQENESCTFSFDDFKDGEPIVFPEKMTEWAQKKAMESKEYIQAMGGTFGRPQVSYTETETVAATAYLEPDEEDVVF